MCDSTSLSLSNRSLNYLASLCHFQFCRMRRAKRIYSLVSFRFVFFFSLSSSSFINLVKMGRNICNIFTFTYLFYVGVKCFYARQGRWTWFFMTKRWSKWATIVCAIVWKQESRDVINISISPVHTKMCFVLLFLEMYATTVGKKEAAATAAEKPKTRANISLCGQI